MFPPHPANFLQRAGRAGRRNESAALSFTLCKATPHGEEVFRNPLWPFITQLAMPKVALQSVPIVQRHLNALTLTMFLLEKNNQMTKLKSGYFMESEEGISALCDRFIEWCQQEINTADTEIAILTKGTPLAGHPSKKLRQRTASAMEQTSTKWRLERDALLEQKNLVRSIKGEKSKAEMAVDLQLKRLRDEYLLSELASGGFLPGYGFPTDVVSFITTTMSDLKRKREENKNEREDNRSRRAGYPSRNLAIAIRDYAPGTDTVLDHRVYRSGGVTLNWHIPAELQQASEIQCIQWMWLCQHCGNTGTGFIKPEQCPVCDQNELRSNKFLQPAGFAVDFYDKTHNDVTTPQYIPVRSPLISLSGIEWLAPRMN